MGDRANIVLRYTDNGKTSDIYLYGHWAGGKYVRSVQASLKRKLRWDDPSYLGRIITFDFLPDEFSETSYGISPYITDNEHDLCIVDLDKWAVKRQKVSRDGTPGEIVGDYTFEQFILLHDDQLDW
jgi:hypothetical protein